MRKYIRIDDNTRYASRVCDEIALGHHSAIHICLRSDNTTGATLLFTAMSALGNNVISVIFLRDHSCHPLFRSLFLPPASHIQHLELNVPCDVSSLVDICGLIAKGETRIASFLVRACTPLVSRSPTCFEDVITDPRSTLTTLFIGGLTRTAQLEICTIYLPKANCAFGNLFLYDPWYSEVNVIYSIFNRTRKLQKKLVILRSSVCVRRLGLRSAMRKLPVELCRMLVSFVT